MSSYEEFKKKKLNNSSYQQFKEKKEKQQERNASIVNNQQTSPKNSSNNRTSLWDNIQNIASGTGKVTDNLWQSLKNGMMSSVQTIDRRATNRRVDAANLVDNLYKLILKKDAKTDPMMIMMKSTTPQLSQEKMQKETQERYDEIQEKKNENILKIQQNAENMNTKVGKYIAGEIAPGIGQMLPGMLPGGTGYFITSAAGNYYDDALQRGMSKEQANAYGDVMGVIEGSLEAVGAKLTTNVGKQLLKKNIKGALVNYGLDIGENFLEESIVEPLSEIVATTTAGKDKADWSNMGQRMWQSGVAGAITSIITGGASGAIGTVGSKVIQQNKYVDYNTNKKLDKNAQNILKQAENIIQENNTTNLQPQSTHNVQSTPNQQVMPMKQENVQNTNIKQNNILPMQSYVYEKSDNVKIDNLRQDASKYFDNSEKTKNYINMLEKIVQDKNIDIRFDTNLKDSQGRIANGSYSNGVITINPNSNRAGEFIAIHELTHAIGTNQMRNIVEQYRKSNTEFDKAVEQLLKNYNATELTEEAMADVSAQLFGNQEFINNLAQTKPSLFRKIYNEIKYLWHQFTGYKNQNQFIEDLQYKWEQAYRNNQIQIDNNTKYSMAGEKAVENIRDNELLYHKAISNYNKANQMAEQKVDNEIIRKNTGWFQDKNGDWKFEFSDKHMALKNIKFEKNKTYKLGNILEHDILFMFYPDLKNYELTFRNLKNAGGTFYKYKNLIAINSNKIKSKNAIEKTLIHEIQHAIQSIEGFEGGRTSKLSKLAYYNSLGEIEATDVQRRFILERKGKDNINKIAPESSKANPQHPRLNNYLKNRKVIDKIKDGVYNYFDNIIERGNNSEEIYEDVSEDIFQDNDNNHGQVGDRLNENSKKYQKENSSTDSEDNGLVLGRVNNKDNKVIEESENNSGSFSMQDNQGRTLTKEQQEYFKESKARDENGNLLEVYHGTNEDFTEFDISYLGSASGDVGFLGDGFYLATHKGEAKYYGSKIMSGYVNIKNPYNIKDLSKYKGKTFNGEDSSSGLHIKNLVDLNPQWRNIEINNTTYGEIADEVTNYLENVKIKKLGIVEDSYGNDSGIMWEISFNGKKTQDESILNYTEEEMIANGLNKHIRNKFGYINSNEIIQYITEENRFNKNIKTLREVLQEKGYDSIVQGTPQDTDEIVIFNSNQFKNVDNKKPTDNPDIRYSLQTKEWQEYLDENYKQTGTRTNLENIRLPVKQNNQFPVNQEVEMANILQKPAEKVKEKDRSWAIIKANLIDKGMVFEELSRKTGNRELQGKWDSTLTSTARGQNAIGNARYELDPKTKTQKQISKSLTDIIDEVGENTADFYSYMYHQLNIDRMTLEERFGGDTGINYERRNPIMNKPVFGESVTAKMSIQKVAELEKKHPEFKEYAQDVYDYLDANTKELVDNGVISNETQQLFKDMYPHYVPISRVRNKGQAINVPLDTGRTGINSPIKKATGGSSDINPLFETMADRTLQTYRASARNSFGVELKNTLGKTNPILEKTDVDTIIENMTDEEQNKQLLQEGKNGENPTFTIFENGNKVTYEITKDMYDALKPKNELLSKIDENKASKMANKINNFRRGLLTEYNPVFSITNAIKDSQDILLNSQHSAKTYAKIPEATAQILSKGYWYNEYIQNGGVQNSYFKDGEFETAKNNLPTKIKNTITFPLRAISNINNVIEMTPRLAEYIVSREQGKSIETSMLDAARVTTNFKAGGDITKTLNRNGFTFLNASVQGMQQQIRNIQEANAKGLKGYAILACKYAIAGAPVILLNNLLWADDDEYEELQDYVKDNYYIIGKLPNGKFLRIPKGRAVATIQKIVSNVNDFVKNDSINSNEVGKIFWEDMKENIQFGIENLAPNNPMENNVLSPIFQAITNKTWYGDDLVPTRLQNKPKEEQYDETTDNFSRWLGEKTGISPIKINYLIDQYSGGAGDVLLPLGTPQAENNVIEDKFTTDATMKSKYPGEFFIKVDELEINKNSSKATDEDILKYKYISSVSTDIGKLYTKKREIQNSAATDKEKKAQLKEVQEQINELAKNSLEAVEKIQNTSTTATIGDKKYYKYHDEWTVLSEEDEKKNKNISLKTYADYKNKVYSQTQTKRAKGELSETQSLKNKDKIQILLNSKYSNNEISAIYDNYIKSSSDTEYNIMKATGIDIKEYLKYKQQEFESDKDDDGTLTGKTVSKSKQKKVVEYLNSMNIKGNQRLLLYAMQGYTTTSSQKTQLANYVKGLKIDQKTKLKLYDKFSGFTVYKDGTIKY